MIRVSEIEPRGVWIDHHFRTGDMREATALLLIKIISVTESCLGRITELNEKMGPQINPLILRMMLSARTLTDGLRINWRRNERRVEGFLRDSAKVIDKPDRIFPDLVQQSVPLPPGTTIDIAAFFDNARVQSQLLLDVVEKPFGNTFNFGVISYIESRALRSALYAGVYVVRPPLPMMAEQPQIQA